MCVSAQGEREGSVCAGVSVSGAGVCKREVCVCAGVSVKGACVCAGV